MNSYTKKMKIKTTKQEEFKNLVMEKYFPYLNNKYNFDLVDGEGEENWDGKKVFKCLPYGELMEPWLVKAVTTCNNNKDSCVVYVMAVKTSTNAWYDYVFPYISHIGFMRKGKRPACYMEFNGKGDKLMNRQSEEEKEIGVWSV